MSKLGRLLLLLFLWSVPILSYAQTNGRFRYKRSPKVFDIKVGIELGIDRSWLAGDKYVVRESELGNDFASFTKFKGRYAFHPGLYIDLQLTNNHFFQLGFRLQNKGWRQEGAYDFSPFTSLIEDNIVADKVEVLANISYLSIPMWYKYKAHRNFFLLTGPFIDIKLNENYKISDDFGVQLPDGGSAPDHYLNINYGLGIGFMYQHKSGFTLLAEYGHGFKNINDNPEITTVLIPRNNLVTTSLTAGYTFMYPNRFNNYHKRKKGLL